ncbi:MAG: delta-60 repeat domain-containing protein, partial [Planctomycetes bacterium]|nr:delta-60 repeat domain-containing protein [Planctomycetota bacterium]
FSSYNGTSCGNIIRLNANGSVDPAFDAGTGFNNTVYAIAPAAGGGTGDIYVGGYFSSYQGLPHKGVIRLKPDGSPDPGFDIGSGAIAVNTVRPAGGPEGRVYVGGTFYSFNGVPCNYIVRVNANGSIDPTFDIGDGFSNWVGAIALVPGGTGDIVVGGMFRTYDHAVVDGIARLHPDGSLE